MATNISLWPQHSSIHAYFKCIPHMSATSLSHLTWMIYPFLSPEDQQSWETALDMLCSLYGHHSVSTCTVLYIAAIVDVVMMSPSFPHPINIPWGIFLFTGPGTFCHFGTTLQFVMVVSSTSLPPTPP